MTVAIDPYAGFCSGVINAIDLVEKELKRTGSIHCLGKIVHNDEEVARLERMGMKTITYEEFRKLKNTTVLIRAHGEPPETYRIAEENNIRLIDGTCPIVSKLQNRVRTCYDEITEENGQIVIFGNEDHPEVAGLAGQIGGNAIIINDAGDLDRIDLNRPVYLFAQTTKNQKEYQSIQEALKTRMNARNQNAPIHILAHQTICGQVANRAPKLAKFAQQYDAIIFISGKESANGKTLFEVCKKNNPRSFFISKTEELPIEKIGLFNSVGISGATSTPGWLIEEVAAKINRALL